MRLRLVFLLIAATSLMALSGCATLIDPGPDRVSVNSNPSGAQVYVNGDRVGTTPTTVSLDRNESGRIRIEKSGYEPVLVERSKKFNSWVIGSICLGIWPIVIDMATDNHEKFETSPVNVTLPPEGGYRDGDDVAMRRPLVLRNDPEPQNSDVEE
ncbi:MAG: PEGA domain-containing protein [Myxococcota bacterium]